MSQADHVFDFEHRIKVLEQSVESLAKNEADQKLKSISFGRRFGELEKLVAMLEQKIASVGNPPQQVTRASDTSVRREV